MKIDLPPSRASVAGDIPASPPFYQFFDALWRMLRGVGGIVILPSYTVATVPSAADFARGLIYVSDGTGNKRLAVSDGTNWRFPDGNIVS